MGKPWHSSLASLRDEFLRNEADLRAVLVRVNVDTFTLPVDHADVAPGENFARWGLPPDWSWRHEVGRLEPLPVVVQRSELDINLWAKHVFYGEGASSFKTFADCAVGVFRLLAKLPREEYSWLASELGLPDRQPDIHHGHHELWWLRAVHGIAKRHPKNSTLWSRSGPNAGFGSHVLSNFLNQQRLKDRGERVDYTCDFSILHDNVFRCSAEAIDVILAVVAAPEAPVSITTKEGSRVTVDLNRVRVWRSGPLPGSGVSLAGTSSSTPPAGPPVGGDTSSCLVLKSVDGPYLHFGTTDDGGVGGITPRLAFVEIEPDIATRLTAGSEPSIEMAEAFRSVFSPSETSVLPKHESGSGGVPEPSTPTTTSADRNPSDDRGCQVQSEVVPPKGSDSETVTVPDLDEKSGRPSSAGTREFGRPERFPIRPDSKVLAVVNDLLRRNRPVTVTSACKIAGVDRKHLRKKYPDVYGLIKVQCKGGPSPARGIVDRRTGNVDCIDEDDD